MLARSAAVAASALLVPDALRAGMRGLVPPKALAREPWGTLTEIGDGIWAMLSTPLVDRTTLCNGGLIAGRDAVLMVEAFGSEDGARWMSDQALALTGKRPTRVVLSHFHADHTAGLPGAVGDEAAAVHVTVRTRALILERNANPPRELLASAVAIAPDVETQIELGGRRVTLRPLEGHTGSDVAVWVEDAATLFSGDLVWWGMFPNFVDAQPSRLSRSVRELSALGARRVVPGHGSLTDADGLTRYVGLLDRVERAAREALAAGVSAEEAGRAFRMPEGMDDWTLFNPRYYERAIAAWMRELAG